MKSILSVSMHKAGSTIADRIITEFCLEKGYQIEKISKEVASSPLTESESFIKYQDKMSSFDTYYGMARGAYIQDMPFIYNLRVIVQVRDPRDCITSSYFSRRLSHVPPKNRSKIREFTKKRELANQMSIDEFASKRINEYKHRMQVLKLLLETHDDILLLNYEEMVRDTDCWLAKLSEFFDLSLSSHLMERLQNKLDFKVDEEDPSKHKRQVEPGDHERKLRVETIKYMNGIAAEELLYFGYAPK